MGADGRSSDPIVVNSDNDSDVLQKGSMAQPIVLYGCSTSDGMLAFVKTNPNIVAISGAIIPDPLAIPMMSISILSIKHFLDETFENVSVVLIVSAAFSQFD